MSILEFVFQSFWHFAGVTLLTILIGSIAISLLKAILSRPQISPVEIDPIKKSTVPEDTPVPEETMPKPPADYIDQIFPKAPVAEKQKMTEEPPSSNKTLSSITIGKDGLSSNDNSAVAVMNSLSDATSFAMVTSHSMEDGSFYIEVSFSNLLEAKTLYELGIAQVMEAFYGKSPGEEE